MANEVLNKFIDRLTSNYNKDPGSNVYKLMQVAANHIQENEDLLSQIGDWRDVDQASGATLDRIGRNVQQNRGQSPDSVYRVLIKSKVKRNLSNGSINTLIDFLAFILQVKPQEIEINELWQKGINATLHINVPAGQVNATGLSLNQFGTLVNLVVAAGVKANVLFEGTFEFGSQPIEFYYIGPGMIIGNDAFAPDKGFANADKTTGGTLGQSYDPAKDYELPF
jgi:hypothetical protein